LRKAIQLLVGVAVSAALLWFATRGSDWGAVGAVLANARWGWILAVIAVSVISVWVRALRWQILLRPVGEVAVYPAFSATAIGFGASAVLPFRVGEIIRPLLLARHTRIPMTAALSSVLLERLLDILLIVTCFLLLSLVYPIPEELRWVAWVAGPTVGLGFALLVVMSRQRARAVAIVDRLFALLPARIAGALRPLVVSFLDGLGALRDLRTVGIVLAYSVYIGGLITVTFLLSFFAVGVVVAYFPAALATVVSVAFTVSVPQLPGFVGGWQTGCKVALEDIFAVDHNVVVAFSLLTWITQMTVNIGTAGFFLAREDLSIRQMLRLAEQTEAPGAGAK
jgi:uncharacterized protein (TIRG00374 family)